MTARSTAVLLALLAGSAMAVDTTEWPPPAPVETRMHELQQIIASPDSTPEQRNAARAELVNLLKSPAGQDRDTTNGRPARAAIQPFGRIVKPAEAPSAGSGPPPAHLEVVTPPHPVALPNGTVVNPSGDHFAVDPRTGTVLHEVPGGYIDPRTGKFTPH
jgi:hypothetical protein